MQKLGSGFVITKQEPGAQHAADDAGHGGLVQAGQERTVPIFRGEKGKHMRRIVAKVGGVLVLACALAVVNVATAEAAFVAAICNDAACDGVGDIIVTDNGVGDFDFIVGPPLTSGVIVTGGAVGGFEITLNSSQTKPVFGSEDSPAINLAYQANNTIGGLADVWLYAGDTDFQGQGNVTLSVNSSTTGQTTTGLALGGDSNAVGAHGLNLDPTIISTTTAGIFTTTITNGPVSIGPYALTAGVRITRLGTGLSSGDVTVTVPEPASLTLFGLGLLGLGGVARRRFAGNRG